MDQEVLLKKHINDRHECPECDADFRFYSELVQHFIENHENVR